MLRVAIAYSVTDPAGSGVARHILELVDAEKAECPMALECHRLEDLGVYIAGFERDTPMFEFVDETPDPEAEAVIVLSRHSSESGKRALTVHHTGNPMEPILGGRPGELAYSYPKLGKTLLVAYRSSAERLGLLEEYDLKLEATHHGPSTPRKPVVFIEIGSDPSAWTDQRARAAMAEAVVSTISSRLPECREAAGFGGSHYPVKFTRMQLESEYCIGHIIPKYVLREVVDFKPVAVQALSKAYPSPVSWALVEKKSLKSGARKALLAVLEEAGVRIELV